MPLAGISALLKYIAMKLVFMTVFQLTHMWLPMQEDDFIARNDPNEDVTVALDLLHDKTKLDDMAKELRLNAAEVQCECHQARLTILGTFHTNSQIY